MILPRFCTKDAPNSNRVMDVKPKSQSIHRMLLRYRVLWLETNVSPSIELSILRLWCHSVGNGFEQVRPGWQEYSIRQA